MFLKPPPFVRVAALFAYGCLLPFAAKQAHWRTAMSRGWRWDGQHKGLTVAKVSWTVSWPLHSFICYPSSPALCWEMVWNVLEVWNLRITHFSHQWARQPTPSLAVWAVDGFRQRLLLRFDPYRLGFLYIEHVLNPLPGEIWQRLMLSTDRPLNGAGKKSLGSRSVQSSCSGRAISVVQTEHIIEGKSLGAFFKPSYVWMHSVRDCAFTNV